MVVLSDRSFIGIPPTRLADVSPLVPVCDQQVPIAYTKAHRDMRNMTWCIYIGSFPFMSSIDGFVLHPRYSSFAPEMSVFEWMTSSFNSADRSSDSVSATGADAVSAGAAEGVSVLALCSSDGTWVDGASVVSL